MLLSCQDGEVTTAAACADSLSAISRRRSPDVLVIDQLYDDGRLAVDFWSTAGLGQSCTREVVCTEGRRRPKRIWEKYKTNQPVPLICRPGGEVSVMFRLHSSAGRARSVGAAESQLEPCVVPAIADDGVGAE